MRGLFLSVALVSILLSACGSNHADSSASPATTAVATLPTTVEGTLTVDVAEGDTDATDTSQFNFGTLAVGNEQISVQVSGSVLSAAGIAGDGVKVKATLGSKSEQFGGTTYTVTALQRL